MKALAVVSLSVSLTALVVAGYSFLSGPRDPRPPVAEGLEARFDELRRESERLAGQVQALERQVGSLGKGAHRGDAAPAAGTGAAGGGREARDLAALRELSARVEELEARLEGPAAAPRAPAAAPGTALPETPEERQMTAARAAEVALDRARSPAERLQALKDLRSRNGRSREIALAMMEIVRDPNLEPRVRADIIRNLGGVAFEELKQPLLAVLQSDPDPETREETVETLQAFYRDPAVHAAVLHARDNDADPKVRAEALRRLSQFEAGAGRGEGR